MFRFWPLLAANRAGHALLTTPPLSYQWDNIVVVHSPVNSRLPFTDCLPTSAFVAVALRFRCRFVHEPDGAFVLSWFVPLPVNYEFYKYSHTRIIHHLC